MAFLAQLHLLIRRGYIKIKTDSGYYILDKKSTITAVGSFLSRIGLIRPYGLVWDSLVNKSQILNV